MNRIKNYVLVSIIIVLFSACEKQDNQDQTNLESSTSKILVFEDNTQLVESLKKITNMNFEEKKQWEESQNFISLGRKADEFYYSIDVENFKSSEEIDEFIQQHSDLIQLVEIAGEPTVETVLYKHPYRYLVNEDGLYQINNEIFLVLEDVIVSTNVSNMNALSMINNTNYIEFENTESIKIQSILNSGATNSSKDPTYNCGVFDEDNEDVGRDRTYVSITMYGVPNALGTNQYVSFLVKPYKKTLGKWFGCGRKISCEMKVAADYLCYYSQNSTPYWVREIGEYSCSEKSGYSVTGILCDYMVSHGFYVTPQGHFGGYDCWGDTHSTYPDVDLEANVFLVP